MLNEGHPSPPVELEHVTPKLFEITSQVLFGDVWERPGLSKRDRSLITCAVLSALYRPTQLKSHISLGLKNGLSKEELGEMITHIAFYAGWPAAVTAAQVAHQVFQQEA